MKKWLKLIIILITILVSIIILDSIQARIFKQSPIISWKEELADSDSWVDKGLIIDTYYCTKEKDIITVYMKFKGNKFTCPIDNEIVDENKELNFKPTEVENVSISISDISSIGATVIIKDTNKRPYTQGEWYKIEKEVDGKWHEVEPIIENYAFNSIGYEPADNNQVKHKIEWKWIYGELPLGSYRILKEVGNKKVSIEFSIATTSDKK